MTPAAQAVIDALTSLSDLREAGGDPEEVRAGLDAVRDMQAELTPEEHAAVVEHFKAELRAAAMASLTRTRGKA